MLEVAGKRSDEIRDMLGASFGKLNGEFGFSLAMTKAPDLSRFLDELPSEHVDVAEAASGTSYGGYAQSRFANMDNYASSYNTPGWQRAQARRNEAGGSGAGGFSERANSWGKGGGSQNWNGGPGKRGPMQIEGELVAKSSSTSGFDRGARVFHQKFGPGTVAAVDGNKLTVEFDKAGRKMVLDSFVTAS